MTTSFKRSEYFSTKEATEKLNVSRMTLYRYVQAGRVRLAQEKDRNYYNKHDIESISALTNPKSTICVVSSQNISKIPSEHVPEMSIVVNDNVKSTMSQVLSHVRKGSVKQVMIIGCEDVLPMTVDYVYLICEQHDCELKVYKPNLFHELDKNLTT